MADKMLTGTLPIDSARLAEDVTLMSQGVEAAPVQQSNGGGRRGSGGTAQATRDGVPMWSVMVLGVQPGKPDKGMIPATITIISATRPQTIPAMQPVRFVDLVGQVRFPGGRFALYWEATGWEQASPASTGGTRTSGDAA